MEGNLKKVTSLIGKAPLIKRDIVGSTPTLLK